jgi:hypothetical protein
MHIIQSRKAETRLEKRAKRQRYGLFLSYMPHFPGATTQLHLYEPRYRIMINDAWAGNRQFIIVRAHRDRNMNNQNVPVLDTATIAPPAAVVAAGAAQPPAIDGAHQPQQQPPVAAVPPAAVVGAIDIAAVLPPGEGGDHENDEDAEAHRAIAARARGPMPDLSLGPAAPVAGVAAIAGVLPPPIPGLPAAIAGMAPAEPVHPPGWPDVQVCFITTTANGVVICHFSSLIGVWYEIGR